MQLVRLAAGQGRRHQCSGRPHPGGQQRRADIGAPPCAFAVVQRGRDRGVDRGSGGVIAAAPRWRRWRCARVTGGGEQPAARPEGGQVEPRQPGVRSGIAEPGDVGVDDPRVPARHFLVAQVQGFARTVREVGDHHIGPLDETLEDLRSALRLQVDGHAALVAIGQVPAVVSRRGRARWHRAQQPLRVTKARVARP